ncbi:phospholysine phosphohistidine inorganic pyrophosphate phosphatase-like [Thunnus maccoyii]|uniref:phospholysine phosphohistidine inorganic pyrophosphate phosphatase-like n=1 Tax=Thunnus maccoyii TaxID=8240 RepID=UPI001C4B07F8|nr:phospholysine phosphohistidine inorganic pyrophosphate phosphatase-like [Thunnus maccoyii]
MDLPSANDVEERSGKIATILSKDVVMIGDDLVNDVGGAQHCGMKGVQVRTGKYRPSDERHPTVTADGTVDNLAQAADMILNQRKH